MQVVRPPKPERPRLQVPAAEQLLRLVKAAEGTYWEIPLLLAATTGARRGEVLAVRWSDLDLEAGRLRITQTLQRIGAELVFVDPKTPRARRQISLPAFAVERLRRHRREQAERRLLVGPGWADRDLVCERGDGRPLQPDSWTGAFKRIAAAAGLPGGMRLHDVRHGYATALLAQGVHPAIASAALGHATPGFTMSVYQHVLDEMTDQAAAAIDAAFEKFR